MLHTTIIKMESKKCSTCGIEKQSEDFYVDRSKKSGLSCQCKECSNIRNSKYRDINKDRLKEYESNRTRSGEQLDKRKRRHNEYMKNYRIKNIDKYKEKAKEYYENNKEVLRLRTIAWRYNFKDVNELAEFYNSKNNKCELCGSDGDGKSLCIDHDHENGHVRGLVCHRCNTAIGFIERHPNLQGVLDYLNERKYI